MYRIGICDDETGTCSELEKMIEAFAKENSIALRTIIWYTGEALCSFLREGNKVDLLFLDIRLTGQSGIDVGNFIRNCLDDMKTAIVFISQRSQYAMQLFKMQPIDFLIKPINQEKIAGVLNLWNRLNHSAEKSLEIKTGKRFFRIPYDDILYLCSNNKIINVIMQERNEDFYGKLKSLCSVLPDNFVTIHQSYIINMDYIEECSYEKVKMMNGDLLNISQTYRKRMREKLVGFYREKKNV